jgi:hypothetical protein
VKRAANAQTGALVRSDAGIGCRFLNRGYGRLQQFPGILLLPPIMSVAGRIFTDSEAEKICLIIDHDALAAARAQIDTKKPCRICHFNSIPFAGKKNNYSRRRFFSRTGLLL